MSSGLESYLDVEERESRKIQPRSVRRILGEMMRFPALIAGGILTVLLGTGAALLEPRIFGYAIDEAMIPKDMALLRELALAFLAVTCIRVASVVGAGYLFEVLGQSVGQNLRLALFSHLQRLPTAVYDKNPAGRLLTRVTNDVSSLNEMFSGGIITMATNALTLVGILAWLFALNLKLGLISASVFPLLMWVSAYFSRRLTVAYRDARSKLSALNAFMAENFMGMKVVHLFNRQQLHKERFDRINNWYADAQFSTVRAMALFQPAITLASGIAIGLVIWFGGLDAAAGQIKVGVLVTYFAYVLSLFQPMRELADKWSVFLSGMASAERIFSILDWPVELQPEEVASRPVRPGFRGDIRFENVWFAYDGEHWVLKDLSLDLPAGTKLGVVGHTGAGKTTLISLLMRFYEPQKGRILLDGRDIREIDKRVLRASIGIIQQDAFLFSGTLRENILFWAKDPEGGKVDRALSGLGFDADWMNKELLERGTNISVGEKQALAFARAMVTDPAIWILDEATANMDSRTEGEIQAKLVEASRGRTTLTIAHRLATVRQADQIIVLHKGALIEKGNHDELVRLNGLYARLYRFQRAQALTEEAATAAVIAPT